MGLFNSDKKEEIPELPELPKLPELPRLPHIPGEIELDSKTNLEKEPLPQLPTLPNTRTGKDFSQNMIKEAVTGRKEDEEEMADELEDEDSNFPRMPNPLNNQLSRDISQERFEQRRKKDPVFIRLDKFEESMKTFEKIKLKIDEAEEMLQDIKKIKEAEELEFANWEKEVQLLKTQIEKIDQDIFSKID